MDLPWFAWIVIIAIVMGGLIAMAGAFSGPRHQRTFEAEKALADNAEANRKVAERLESIEQRLTAIEKTLNDIP